MVNSWKLADHPKLPKGKVVAMVVLDGWGEAHDNQYNCISVAETPTMDSLKNVLLFFYLLLFTCLYILNHHLISYHFTSGRP